MKPVHIELSNERRDISVLEILTNEANISNQATICEALSRGETDARTFENSDVGDMTKLSLVLDHDIRC
jgi:hypothetical protein